MSQPAHTEPEAFPPGSVPTSPRDGIWAGLIGVTFVVSLVVAYRPSLDNASHAFLAVLPWLVLAGLVGAWAGRAFPTRLAALAVAIGGWGFLVFADDRWSLFSFALYGLCFTIDSTRLRVGLVLAGLVSVIWTVASLGSPLWILIIPLFVFVAASTIAYAIHRIGRLTARQAALIRQLEAAQDDLAASERARGVLEERARLAGEIHDTLAQGFASIVLLARGSRRSAASAEDNLESIETTAQENLDTARRLVESSRPDELDETSLPDALDRHLGGSLPEGVSGELEVVGPPRPLPGATETVLLRAAQEGLRNVYLHAEARRVDVKLSYLDDSVSLDVSDDGVGFEYGQVNDRGTLTGGQGLATLARRVESLSGTLMIERLEGGGSMLAVQIPTSR